MRHIGRPQNEARLDHSSAPRCEPGSLSLRVSPHSRRQAEEVWHCSLLWQASGQPRPSHYKRLSEPKEGKQFFIRLDVLFPANMRILLEFMRDHMGSVVPRPIQTQVFEIPMPSHKTASMCDRLEWRIFQARLLVVAQGGGFCGQAGSLVWR